MTHALPSRVFEPCYGRARIERRAWTCLERCRKRLGLTEIPLPVPVDQWIETPLGIRFGFADLTHLGEGTLGAAFVTDREILIDERVLKHEGRFRFTCAHELGHLVLHRRVQSVFYDDESLHAWDSLETYERQADRFAAAFLMPVPLVERELIRILDAHGLKRAKAVLELTQSTEESEWLWRTIVLPTITRRFDVSLSAAVHRFGDLKPKLPESGPLLPRELAEILLKPASDSTLLNSVWIEDGVTIHRELFSAEAKESKGL